MSHKHAFTLVELSIVLVILGLLVGGVLTGQSLIKAAELRAIATESSRFITATYTFRDKYMGLPGDITNATAYWGRAAATGDCVSNSGAATVTGGSCDGNGDGVLSPSTIVAKPANQSAEIFQFWAQLAKAGLIEGTYTGYAASGGTYNGAIGINYPKSKYPASGWAVSSLNGYAGSANDFAGDYNNYFIFGESSGPEFPQNKALRPEDAYNIDMKIDDGKPAMGRIVIGWRATCTISSGPTDYAATYNLAATTKECMFFFKNIP